MRYVQRDATGQLIGHYANPHPYAQEEVPDDHQDIVAWRAQRVERERVDRERTSPAALEARIAVLEDIVKELQARSGGERR